jgi:hypothetical protein
LFGNEELRLTLGIENARDRIILKYIASVSEEGIMTHTEKNVGK